MYCLQRQRVRIVAAYADELDLSETPRGVWALRTISSTGQRRRSTVSVRIRAALARDWLNSGQSKAVTVGYCQRGTMLAEVDSVSVGARNSLEGCQEG